ncbi:hypothetical protein BDV59DRAFT_207202 [Aspergillus ambiguus]|uniref:uncharacterized protein n=1 Tax=Aspergillus ambiguus TaxID=176160 RepID=UPI003CCDC887
MSSRGERLLAATVDYLVDKEPTKPFAVIPRGPEISDGFQTLRMKDLFDAINILCWWIEKRLGTTRSQETLAYIGSNDVRYCFFVLACQKMGYKPFLPSTRNAHEATIHLLATTKCTKIFYSEQKETHVLEILSYDNCLEAFQVPSIRDILDNQVSMKPYPWRSCYADLKDATACIIHSSGTTGPPKPVFLTNGFFAAMDSYHLLSWPEGRQPNIYYNMGEAVLTTTPFFHIMGLISFVISIYHGTPAIFGPDKPLSVTFLVELMQATRPAAAVYPPSIVEDLSQSDEALNCLRHLKCVFVGGAPLAQETGDLLSKYTRLVTTIGSSEAGWIPAMVPENKAHWAYYEWSPAYGVEMHDIGDGVFELVIPRQPHSRHFHCIFHTFPHLDIYHTNDLFIQHPTLPHLWKFYGRRDDLIVLSNGEKFNPVPMEMILESHALIRSAVIVGQARFEAALLVEPIADAFSMDGEQFIDEIWPTVQAANHASAGYTRITKGRIKLASNKKPFKKTPKGTTQRRAVLRDYETEVHDIYAANLIDNLEYTLEDPLDLPHISEYTRQIVYDILGKSVPDEEDLYRMGFDSLMTIRLSNILQRGVRLHRPHVEADVISPQAIYENPTIKRISKVIFHVVSGHTHPIAPREQKIQNAVDKYVANLPRIGGRAAASRKEFPSVILMTGSTGSLGTYLLHNLLECPAVSTIYCLTRSSNANSRLAKSFEEKGLLFGDQKWAEKLTIYKSSLAEPNMGLDGTVYTELLESVDAIIHAAWKVDFNQSLDAFDDTDIRGMKNLVDFTIRSANAHLHFISSIGTVGNWSPKMGPSVPEAPIEDCAPVVPNGYSESKYICERICFEAARRSSISATVYRVGQIAGPVATHGKWNPQEWLPTLIATSKAMGKIPATLGSAVVDWIPVDMFSEILVEIIQSRHSERGDALCAFFHLVNPSIQPWSSLIPAVKKLYRVEEVEYHEWLTELEKTRDPTAEDVKNKPALKLLPFYRGLLKDSPQLGLPLALDTCQTQNASKKMQSMGPITSKMMENWLMQWDF